MAFASGIRAGKAFIELALDDNLLRRQLRGLQRRFRNLGRTLAGIGTGLTLGGLGLSAPFIGAIKAAGDFEETLSRFRVVYGNLAGEQQKFFDELGQRIGRSRSDILQFASDFQDIGLAIELSPEESAKFSQALTKLSFDLASFYNVSDRDAFERLRSGLNGSSEVLERFNVNIKQAALEAKLLEQGIKFNEATEAQKKIARFNLILEQTKRAQGDVLRTSDSFVNQMKTLNAQAGNAAVTIGSALLPAVTSVVKGFNTFGPVISKFLSDNQELVVVVAALAGSLIPLGIALSGVSVVIIGISTAFGTLATVVGAIGAPLVLLVGSIAAITAAFVDWGAAAESAKGILRSLTEGFEGFGDAIAAKRYDLLGELIMLRLADGLQRGRRAVTAQLVTLGGVLGDVADMERFLNENLGDGNANQIRAIEAFLKKQKESNEEKEKAKKLDDEAKAGADSDLPTNKGNDAARSTPVGPFDEQVKAFRENEKREQEIADEVKALRDSLKTPQERILEEIKRGRELFDDGRIDGDLFGDLIRDADKRLSQLDGRSLPSPSFSQGRGFGEAVQRAFSKSQTVAIDKQQLREQKLIREKIEEQTREIRASGTWR